VSEDLDLTNKILRWLSNQSFIDNIFIDTIELKIGENLKEKINRGIRSSDFLIPLITNNSRNRKWVKYEIKTAMKEETNIKYKVLPLVHNDCKKVPKYLEHKIYLRIDDSLTELDKIIESITKRYRLEIKLNSNFKLNENDLREKLNLYSRHKKNSLLCQYPS
jgi:TIR domain